MSEITKALINASKAEAAARTARAALHSRLAESVSGALLAQPPATLTLAAAVIEAALADAGRIAEDEAVQQAWNGVFARHGIFLPGEKRSDAGERLSGSAPRPVRPEQGATPSEVVSPRRGEPEPVMTAARETLTSSGSAAPGEKGRADEQDLGEEHRWGAVPAPRPMTPRPVPPPAAKVDAETKA